MFEVRINDRELKKLERSLAEIPRAMGKVMSLGLNRTATEARTKIARSLAPRTGLNIKDVRDRTILRRATYSRWRSGVSISRKRIPLARFGARQTKKGVTYKQGSGRKRVLIRHAFISQMPGGHTGVFRRKYSRRLPIVELRGPSLGQVWSSAHDEARRIFTESQARLAKNISDQVNLILQRRARAG